jgi:hypothetical protein
MCLFIYFVSVLKGKSS